MQRSFRYLFTASITLLIALLSGCGGGSSSSSTTSFSGTLTLNNSTPIQQYVVGTAIAIPVTAAGSGSSATVPVTITSSNPRVVSVSPSTCYLSGSAPGDVCQVIVRGIAAGTVTLTASTPGATDVLITATYGGTAPATPNYGSVQIGSFPSAIAPSTSNVNTTAQLGKIVTLQTSLTGFDTALDGVPILLSADGGATFVGNPQCNVDSAADANHYCMYQLQLPSTAPANNTVTVTANVVGAAAAYQTWNAPTVTITTQSTSVAGSVVLQSTGAGAPKDMSSPIWAVLQDSSGVGNTVVTLNTSNGNVVINPGVSVSTGAYQTKSCTLSSTQPVCGFGVKGVTVGDETISAIASSGGYVIASLPLAVTAQLNAARVIKFANSSTSPVWVGITGGTSNSYETNTLVSTIDPSTSGPNKMCGPSNSAGACPTGSTCLQGGANPNSSTTYFCYWDQPVPSNGYALASNATTSTSISISNSSYDPIADITWSGNFYPRQGCTLSSTTGELTCTVADCGNATSGSACAPGTGGAPAVATLPEVTLQLNNTDYYDVSIIGGANVKTSFGPDSSAATTASPVPAASGYSCGTAGGLAAQGSLAAADWNMATHVVDTFITGASTPYSFAAQTGVGSTAYYQFVSTVTPRQNTGCTSSSACTTSGYKCGYDANAIDNGTSSDYVTSCGQHLAWLSANAVWALNTSTASNTAPFHFTGSYTDAASAVIQYNQLFTCTAPTVSGYSSPITDVSQVCGCTNWGDTALTAASGDASFTAAVAAPASACTANNTVTGSYLWTDYVLPSIAWLKKSCPTCYTYPFDDKSSTFQCSNQTTAATGTNSVPYVITFNGDIPGL